jgi:hypothetical protein
VNFAIPRKNDSEMVLYIWKIIELPSISLRDLLYELSFELSLFSPNGASQFIQKVVDNNFLIEAPNNMVKLSPNLEQKLKNWHIKRKAQILKKIESFKKETQEIDNFDKNNVNKFNTLLKAFLDKGTINRAVTVSDSAFNIIKFDPKSKIIKAEVKGSSDAPYHIEISINDKFIKHNCHDFQTNRAKNKKFCKHLAKLFLLLKKKNEKSASFFLERITSEINNWDFLS